MEFVILPAVCMFECSGNNYLGPSILPAVCMFECSGNNYLGPSILPAVCMFECSGNNYLGPSILPAVCMFECSGNNYLGPSTNSVTFLKITTHSGKLSNNRPRDGFYFQDQNLLIYKSSIS